MSALWHMGILIVGICSSISTLCRSSFTVSRWKWNLEMFIFGGREGGKPENPVKETCETRMGTKEKLNPHVYNVHDCME